MALHASQLCLDLELLASALDHLSVPFADVLTEALTEWDKPATPRSSRYCSGGALSAHTGGVTSISLFESNRITPEASEQK